MKRIYLDYAASMPLRSEVARAMRCVEHTFGNPSSLHSFGQAARALVDRARERIAAEVGAGFREIIFTGSATEANNLALRGITRTVRGLTQKVSEDPRGVRVGQRPRLIISAIEHESVLETARDLERSGEAEIVMIPVNRCGVVDVKALERALDERTVLVSVMYVNNEVGTIQPIAEISNVIRDFRNSKLETLNSKSRFYRGSSTKSGQIRSSIPAGYLPKGDKFQIPNISDLGFRGSDLVKKYPLFHVDAAQAFAYLDCDVNKLGVDLMTLSGHKIGGPKGIGALFVRNSKHEARNPKQILNSKFKTQNTGVSNFPGLAEGLPRAGGFRISDLPLVEPMVTGGNQEFGLRAGTENVAAIAGFAEAATLAVKERTKSIAHAARLKELFLKELKRARVKFMENVPREGASPHILNLRFPDLAAEELLVRLDLAGVAVSAGSACTARALVPSRVLLAMGMPKREVEESIRISFGIATTTMEVCEASRRFARAVAEMA